MVAQRFLRRKQVLERYGFKDNTLYRLMGSGDFPRPVRLGGRIPAWRVSELDEYDEKLTK